LASRSIFASASSGTPLFIHLMNSCICICGKFRHGLLSSWQPPEWPIRLEEIFRFCPASTSDSEKDQNYAPPLSRTKKDRPDMTKVEIVSHIPGDHDFVSL
jgi:hypothetical protein